MAAGQTERLQKNADAWIARMQQDEEVKYYRNQHEIKPEERWSMEGGGRGLLLACRLLLEWLLVVD
jgi:hypothetical protein